MIKLITIKADGFYAHEKGVENEDYSQIDIREAGRPFSYYTNYFVNIENNVTVENLMDILMAFEDDIDFLFMGYTKGLPIRPYYEEMKLEVRVPSSIDFVEICWGTDYLDLGDDFAPDLIIEPDFVGVNEESLKESEPGISPYYTMSIVPLNEWKHADVRIDEIVEFVKYVVTPDEDPNFQILLYGNKDWHLHEFLRAFLQEITFHGSPSEKASRMEDLVKFRDEAIEKGGTIIITDDGESWSMDVDISDVVDEKELRRNLKEAVENDEFEDARKISDQLKEIKKKKDK